MLNDRNTNFREIQAKKIYEGRKLYEQIKNEGNNVKWGNDGFEHFIEFYNTIDPPLSLIWRMITITYRLVICCL